MIKRAFALPGIIFLLVCLWKIALWAIFALPVPSNDAFFYDGPVVNLLLHGKYANPPLGQALPISGHELFSAYPPFYQCVLLLWMTCFGTSAFAAMGLHVFLFCLFAWLLFLVLRRVQTPLPAMHLAAGFLLLITFTDRPDSLAHVLGFAAIYSWVRASRALSGDPETPPAKHWWWATAVLAVLALATGLQIGALYASVLLLGAVLCRVLARETISWVPLAAIVLLPVVLVGFVILFVPPAWAGFLEHAAQTPSFTGLRLPRPDEVMKLLRTVPGLLISPLLLLFLLTRRQLGEALRGTAGPGASSVLILSASTTLPGLAMLAAAMFVLTANSVLFTLYLQPLVLGTTVALSLCFAPLRNSRPAVAVVLALMALGSIRAVGLTTWGVACAVDVGYSRALAVIRSELAQVPADTKVVFSSAYLYYQAQRFPNIKAIHSDWMQPADHSSDGDWRAFTKVRPAKLVLTQFDFYRRYQPLVLKLQAQPELATFTVTNAAHVPAPDSFPPLRRVLQHVSWAPVVVTVDWR